MVVEGRRIVPGLTPILRAASVVEETTDGVLVLHVPGELGSQRLRDTDVLPKLEKALALHSGRDSAKISILAEEGGSETGAVDAANASRISQETVRATRLQELIRRAPYLERAVAELDLELVE